MFDKTERIRAQNDRLRVFGLGGEVMVTQGIAALSGGLQAQIMAAVQGFTAFTKANDPHGEHDFALLEVARRRVMFKIDYYDSTLTGHSPDEADPAVTRRVLTIMLAEEY